MHNGFPLDWRLEVFPPQACMHLSGTPLISQHFIWGLIVGRISIELEIRINLIDSNLQWCIRKAIIHFSLWNSSTFFASARASISDCFQIVCSRDGVLVIEHALRHWFSRLFWTQIQSYYQFFIRFIAYRIWNISSDLPLVKWDRSLTIINKASPFSKNFPVFIIQVISFIFIAGANLFVLVEKEENVLWIDVVNAFW